VFSGHPDLECASAGLNHDAENVLTSELVEWADVIFVMEKTHKAKLTSKFNRHLKSTRVVVLDIPDNYEFMDPELVKILESKVGRNLASGG
jgi:predicted protein tyrosine phosphatase